jgi:hypothetical protein
MPVRFFNKDRQYDGKFKASNHIKENYFGMGILMTFVAVFVC